MDDRGLFYVLDVHKDEMVYLEEPPIAVPEPAGNRGRKPTNLKTDRIPFRLDTYKDCLLDQHWKKVKIRKTAKGWFKLRVHTCRVWSWDGQEERAREMTLVITKTVGKKSKIKCSFSNGGVDEYDEKDYGYFQVRRYWVVRTFDDSKSELGLSVYQVRKWSGWHHRHSLVLMATLFMMNERIAHGINYPLLSVRDLKILMIVLLFGTPDDFEKRLEQMKIRHKNRTADIDRHYENDEKT